MESCPALDCVIYNAEPFAWDPINSRGSALHEDFCLVFYCAFHTLSTLSCSLYIPLLYISSCCFLFFPFFFLQFCHSFLDCKSPSVTFCIEHNSQQRASCHSLAKASSGIFSVLQEIIKIVPERWLSTELEEINHTVRP